MATALDSGTGRDTRSTSVVTQTAPYFLSAVYVPDEENKNMNKMEDGKQTVLVNDGL